MEGWTARQRGGEIEKIQARRQAEGDTRADRQKRQSERQAGGSAVVRK